MNRTQRKIMQAVTIFCIQSKPILLRYSIIFRFLTFHEYVRLKLLAIEGRFRCINRLR